jgi:Flp pilus assembly protein TadD
LLGKIAFATGEYRLALDELDRAMRVDLDDGEKSSHIGIGTR